MSMYQPRTELCNLGCDAGNSTKNGPAPQVYLARVHSIHTLAQSGMNASHEILADLFTFVNVSLDS